MKLVLSVILFALACYGYDGECRNTPCQISGNFATELRGNPDTRRPCCWGDEGVVYNNIVFSPPAGYRVKILRVYGDFLIWPTRRGAGPAIVPPGTFAGALWALHTTATTGSRHATNAADGHLLYIQNATDGGVARAAVDFDTSAADLLEPDHTLISKMAVWLNDTGLEIHMEPTWTIVFQYVSTSLSTQLIRR